MAAIDSVPTSPALTPRLRWASRNTETLSTGDAWQPTAQLYASGATLDDRRVIQNSGLVMPVSQTLLLVGGAVLRGDTPINGIRFFQGTTILIGPVNQWACLVDQNLNVLAKTNDNGAGTVWSAGGLGTPQDFTFAAPFTPASSLPAYLGLLINAGTVPNLRGFLPTTPTLAPFGLAPVLAGSSTTGLTNPASLGATVIPITGLNCHAYAHLI